MMDDKPAGTRSGWKQDPGGVRKNILAVAMAEFAANGLSGARIDEIAAKTKHVEADDLLLFRRQGGPLRAASWKKPTAQVRAGEQELELDHLPPVEALRRSPNSPSTTTAASGFHPHRDDREHPSRRLSRAVRADPPAQCRRHPEAEAICRRGARPASSGTMLDPLELHWHISALELLQRLQPRHLLAHFRQRAFQRRRSKRSEAASGRDGLGAGAKARAPAISLSAGRVVRPRKR